MITEDYVSFETAKLLKEKGFDGFCNRYYQTDKEDVNGEYALFMFASDLKSFCTITNSLLNKYADKNHEIISAPTLQMAMKWLREKHNLHIITLPYAPMDRYAYHPDFEADMVYIAQLFKGIIPKDEIGRKVIKLTHEEACEAAIKYCLENLI